MRRTRRLLHEALLTLVAERGYDRVTVQDILERADLARATFYAHFRDKDDLLLSGLDHLEQVLRQAMADYAQSPEHPPVESIGPVAAIFDHVAAHRRLYRALVSSRAGPLVLREVRQRFTALVREHLQEVLVRRASTPSVPIPIIAEFVVGALIGVLTWWLDSDPPTAPGELAGLLERLTTPAVETGLGLRS